MQKLVALFAGVYGESYDRYDKCVDCSSYLWILKEQTMKWSYVPLFTGARVHKNRLHILYAVYRFRKPVTCSHISFTETE